MAKKKKKTTKVPVIIAEIKSDFPICKRNFECDDCEHFADCHEYDMLEDDYIPTNPSLIRFLARESDEPNVTKINEFYEEREDVDFFDGEER